MLNRRPEDATERLVDFCRDREGPVGKTVAVKDEAQWRNPCPWRSGSSHALVKGIVDYIDVDTEEARLQAIRRAAGSDRRPSHGRDVAWWAISSAQEKCSCRRW